MNNLLAGFDNFNIIYQLDVSTQFKCTSKDQGNNIEV